MESKSRRASIESSGQSEPPDVPERWSAQRKTELVLRLLRGEPLDTVSRESQVPAHELEEWQRAFLEAGSRGLKRQSDAEDLIERLGYRTPAQVRAEAQRPRAASICSHAVQKTGCNT